MPYSFVWLYLIKCVFTCSIFVNSSPKIFLSVLGVFGKYFVRKIWKFQKTLFCPVLATQSRVGQVASLSCVFVGHFWRLVREWKVQSRSLLRDFRGSARDSLAGRPSSREKHLEKFFQMFFLECFGSLIWRLVSVAKIACFGITGAVFKLFVFPSIFLWLFIVFLICSYLFTPCLHFRSPLFASFQLKIIE